MLLSQDVVILNKQGVEWILGQYCYLLPISISCNKTPVYVKSHIVDLALKHGKSGFRKKQNGSQSSFIQTPVYMIVGADMYESIPDNIYSSSYLFNIPIPSHSSFCYDKAASTTRQPIHPNNFGACIWGTYLMNKRQPDLHIWITNGLPQYKIDLYEKYLDLKDATGPLERGGRCGFVRDWRTNLIEFMKLNKDKIFKNGKCISFSQFKSLKDLKFAGSPLFIHALTGADNIKGTNPQVLSLYVYLYVYVVVCV